MDRKKVTTSYTLAVDIDASSLGFLVLAKNEAGLRVIFEQRRSFNLYNAFDAEALFQKISFSLDEFLLAYKKHHKEVPEKIFIQLSEPWASSEQIDVHYKKEEPFIVDDNKINNIVLNGLPKLDPSLRLFEKRVCSLDLNGYSTDDYLNKKVYSIDLSLHLASMTQDFFARIEHQIERHFICPIEWNSRSFLYYNLLQELFPHEENYLLVEVSGLLTQVLSFKKRHLESNITLPFGKNTLIKHFAESEGLALEKAHALLEMYAKKTLSEQKSRFYKSSISSALRSWLEVFYNALLEISSYGSLPHVFVISTDDPLELLMAHYLNVSTEISELGAKSFSPRVISFEKNFFTMLSKKKELLSIKDPKLSAFVYFLLKNNF